MARLIAKPALPAGELLSIGGVTVRSAELGPVTHIAPFAGTRGEVSEGLSALGLEWPEPGGTKTSDIARILWAGRNAALLIGAAPPVGLETSAALSDQTGANAAVRISGAGAEEVLARLVPVDLRPATFPEGATIRTLLGHMTASLTRTGPEEVEIMVMRSMAGTLLHDLDRAMRTFASRPIPTA